MDPQTLSSQLALQYMQALTQTIQLNGVPQIVQPYQVWNWGGKSYPMGSVPYQQVSALDVVPNDPAVNIQIQTGAAGTGFADNYQLFLNFINPTPQKTDPTYQQYQQQVKDDSRTQYGDEQDAQIAYNNFARNSKNAETYQQWLANEGISYQTQLNVDKQQLQQDQDQLQNYATALGGPVTAAQSAYTKGLIQIQDQTGNAVTVAPWQTDQNPYDYVNQITNNNFGGDAVNGSSRSFSINQSMSQYSNSEVWSEGGARVFSTGSGSKPGASSSRSTPARSRPTTR